MPRPTIAIAPSARDSELAAALEAIVTNLELAAEFSPSVVREAEASTGPSVDWDATGIDFITIDPPGATDLDQAFFIERDGDGFCLWYAISAISRFVTPGGEIDRESRERGQTIYAPTGRIPLYPPVLSEDRASLLADRDRPAFIWRIWVDAAGLSSKFSLDLGVIRSRAQLDYEKAQQLIDDGTGSPSLLLLRELGEVLISAERERGGASLALPETEIKTEGSSYVLDRRSPLAAEGWNAQLSLLTGRTAGAFMVERGIGIVRTMPAADERAIEKFRLRAEALGHPWVSPQPYGEFLRSLDTTQAPQLAIMHAAASLFRGAGYLAFDGSQPEGAEQAAIGALYAHTTAPLRRLVDRFVLETVFAEFHNSEVPAWVREALPTLPAIMTRSGSIAGTVDRTAVDTLEAAELAHRVGETFEATAISTSTIQLADPAVSAKCTGELTPGTQLRVRLDAASIATASATFSALP